MLRSLRVAVLCIILGLLSTTAFAANIQRETFALERAGIDLYLERYQTDEEGDKKPILLVHGLTYSSHEFDVDYGDYSLARFLANNGYAVWLLDIAGYGRSEPVDDGFLPASDYAVEDIEAAARRITAISGTEKLDVLGWSWGTVTSGRFAAQYPDLVNKLVLYAPVLAGALPEGWTLEDYEQWDAPVPPFHENTWVHAAGDFQKTVDGDIDYDIAEHPVTDTFLSNCWRYDGNSSPNGGRRDVLTGSEVRLIPTADIKAPTLLIVGSNDPNVGGSDTNLVVPLCEEARNTLADGKLKIIEGAAHAMMMEKPYYKEFQTSVLEFLSPGSTTKTTSSGGGCDAGWGAGVLLLGGAVAVTRMVAARKKREKARARELV
jgi:pimeloyl-ACP methyl ester carboxylesterase